MPRNPAAVPADPSAISLGSAGKSASAMRTTPQTPMTSTSLPSWCWRIVDSPLRLLSTGPSASLDPGASTWSRTSCRRWTSSAGRNLFKLSSYDAPHGVLADEGELERVPKYTPQSKTPAGKAHRLRCNADVAQEARALLFHHSLLGARILRHLLQRQCTYSSTYDSYPTRIILLELLCGKGKFNSALPEAPCTGWLGSYTPDASAVEAAAELAKRKALEPASPAQALRLLQGQSR